MQGQRNGNSLGLKVSSKARIIFILMIVQVIIICTPTAMAQDFRHGLSLYGQPKYDRDFKHFDYVNSAAPRGGNIRLGALSRFNNFNLLTFRGSTAPGLSLIYDNLVVGSQDESNSIYGSLAEGISIAEDKRSMTFRLREGLTWHDGMPLTAHDVVWTYETALGQNGLPVIKSYLADVQAIKALNDRDVQFIFRSDDNRELPLIIGNALPILPKHYWQDKDITEPTSDIPVGSGAYRIKSVDANTAITYQRVPDYWQDRYATGVGSNNFEEIEYIVFNDRSVMREAAKSGEIDYFIENVAKEWATGYDIDDVREGKLIKENISDGLPHGMQGFIYNLRRFPFQDRVLREALAYAMDFAWMNANLFHGQYTRTQSFFGAEGMSADKLPDAGELKILEPLRDQLPAEVFSQVYTPPQTDGTAKQLRDNLSKALSMLMEAGYTIRSGQLYAPDGGEEVRFELLIYDATFERVSLPFKNNAERLGIKIDLQRRDPVEYSKRIENLDFDMIVGTWGQSLSPGNEQASYWGSDQVDKPGTFNLTGISSQAIDKIISHVIMAQNRENLLTATRALDRVLLHSHIVIPHYYSKGSRYIYRSFLDRPEPTLKGVSFLNWWIKP